MKALNRTTTAIESKNYGILGEKTIIKRGVPVKLNKKTFQINGGKFIKLKYLSSLTSNLRYLCKHLESEGKLTNLFGERVKLD